MITAGIDVGTCTGLAMVGEGEDRGKTIEVPKERGFLRLQLIANDVAETLQIWKPVFAAIEGYAFVRNVHSFITLVEVGTVIRMTLRQLEIPWVEVPPTVLKKWTAASGKADKVQMARAVKARWGHQSPSYDIVDAFALAHMAQLGWFPVQDITGVVVGWDGHKKQFSV